MTWSELPFSWPAIIAVLAAGAAWWYGRSKGWHEDREFGCTDAVAGTLAVTFVVLFSAGWVHAIHTELELYRCQDLHDGWQDDDKLYDGRNPCASEIWRLGSKRGGGVAVNGTGALRG